MLGCRDGSNGASADMDAWSAQRVWFCLPQDFSGDRRGIPFAKGEELQQVHEGVPFLYRAVRLRR